MLETLTQQKETFSNENIAGISVSVEDKLASLFVTGVNSYDEPSFAEYTQNEIREFISLLLDVHEYMDLNQKQQEDNQMKLFDEAEENEAEEIIIDESDEALHILRDSIESYIKSLGMKEDGKEKEQLKDSVK